MIAAVNYDFVNVTAGLIHNRGRGFASASPMPTYEDAAYMREIYRTAKLWNGYEIRRERDYYPTAGAKDTIGMMPTRERWVGDLEEVRDLMNAAGMYWTSKSATRSDLVQRDYLSAATTPLTDDWVKACALVAAANPAITAPGGMIPRFDTMTELGRVATALKTWETWHWRWRVGLVNNYAPGATALEAGLETFFTTRSYGWQHNGSSCSEREVYPGFPSARDPNYKPAMYIRRKTSSADDIYAKEGAWGYTFAAPPWTHGRTGQSSPVIVPVFRVRVNRLWKFTKDGVASYGNADAKFYDFYWCAGGQYDTLTINGIPLNGGWRDLAITQGSIADLGNFVVENTGAANLAGTSPRGGVPSGYTASPDGYEALVDIAAVMMLRSEILRDLNP